MDASDCISTYSSGNKQSHDIFLPVLYFKETIGTALTERMSGQDGRQGDGLGGL